MIHADNKVGQINGMWANSMGQGGVIPIQVKYFPATRFLEMKLTGMQGDVMKESMNVALTLAWELTDEETKRKIREINAMQGIHIHCPEGSVPKDGPSAGAAITTAIYSLFNGRKIKNHIAITGEISLDGKITEIGGLHLKIMGSLKAGITEFIYPLQNQRDFDDSEEDNGYCKNEKIRVHSVQAIEEVFELIFES